LFLLLQQDKKPRTVDDYLSKQCLNKLFKREIESMTNDKSKRPTSSNSKATKSSDGDKHPTDKTKTASWVSDDIISNFFGRVSGVTSSALKIARKTSDTSYKVGKAIIQSQDQLRLMVSAGQSLKDMREVAGLTINELSEAISLKDQSILEAVENGTATLSFELILRLSALLARNDPIPFILKYSRTYSPDTWKLLHDWGAGRLPLQYQREREFINIYRSQDQARQLSDEGFSKVLEFTRQAFNMSLHFASEQEISLRNEQHTKEEKSNKSQQKDETSARNTNPEPKNKND
jgi:transcriptional regulator with XRE-family HTH domain